MKKTTFLIAFLVLATIGATAQPFNTSYNTDSVPITGNQNCSFGVGTLFANTGSDNVGVGFRNMEAGGSGSKNVALGSWALRNNSTGYDNVASGYRSLINNTIGYENVASGSFSLFTNSSGRNNTALGFNSMYSNTNGTTNIGVGSFSLYLNTSGSSNQAIGFRSLYSNTTGTSNSAVGRDALSSNTTGSCNSALGTGANVSTSNLTNATAIGCGAIVNNSNKIRLGNATVTVVEGPVAYTFSDGRFKSNVKDEVVGLEFIRKLRPVVYNLETKKIQDFLTQNMSLEERNTSSCNNYEASTKIRQTGFIAQEVEAAAKEIGYDFNGVHVPDNENDNYSIAYSQFVMPLVKGMQEQQQMIEEQQTQIDELKKMVAELLSANKTSATQNQTQNDNVAIHPNPTTDIINFTFNKNESGKVEIYNLEGKLVLTQDFKDTKQLATNLSSQSDGFYIAKITTATSTITKRIIKE